MTLFNNLNKYFDNLLLGDRDKSIQIEASVELYFIDYLFYFIFIIFFTFQRFSL